MSRRMNKNKQEEIEADKQNRRNNRSSMVVAIAAVLVTVYMTWFKYILQVFTNWPKKGLIYYILIWGIYIFPLSGGLLISYNAIVYIIKDLNRYNVKNISCKELDEESDKCYEILTTNFEFVLRIIISWMVFSGIVFTLTDYFLKNIFINCTVVSIICLIIIIFLYKKQVLKKDVIIVYGRKIRDVIVISMLVLLTVLSILIMDHPQVDITYSDNGKIILEDEYTGSVEGISICVTDINEKNIATQEVNKEDALWAMESETKYVKMGDDIEVASGQDINEEKGYFRYQYDLEDLQLTDGKYYVVIEVSHHAQSAKIENMFEMADGKYTFAKKEFSKKL